MFIIILLLLLGINMVAWVLYKFKESVSAGNININILLNQDIVQLLSVLAIQAVRCKPQLQNINFVKGTVSLILSDPPCTDSNARLTIVPFNPYSDQKFLRDNCFLTRKVFISPLLLIAMNVQVTFAEKLQMKINS